MENASLPKHLRRPGKCDAHCFTHARAGRGERAVNPLPGIFRVNKFIDVTTLKTLEKGDSLFYGHINLIILCPTPKWSYSGGGTNGHFSRGHPPPHKKNPARAWFHPPYPRLYKFPYITEPKKPQPLGGGGSTHASQQDVEQWNEAAARAFDDTLVPCRNCGRLVMKALRDLCCPDDEQGSSAKQRRRRRRRRHRRRSDCGSPIMRGLGDHSFSLRNYDDDDGGGGGVDALWR